MTCPACTASSVNPLDAGDAFIAGLAYTLLHHDEFIRSHLCNKHTERMLDAVNHASKIHPNSEEDRRKR